MVESRQRGRRHQLVQSGACGLADAPAEARATLAGVANENLLRPIIEMLTTSGERYCDVATQGQGTPGRTAE